MRKLTVLLLSGALLAITGGASAARADGFAILECFATFRDPASWAVGKVDTSFDTPEECVTGKSCSKCAAAITENGDLKLADSNLGKPNLSGDNIEMIFAESDDDDKDRRKDKDDDDDDDD